jgi:small-conductance mechanosensitive channel
LPLLVWAIVALHIIGLLPDLIAVIESVGFNFGKQRLSLWDLLQGLVAVLVTVLAALWLSSAIEARLDARPASTTTCARSSRGCPGRC